jgi:hypothetical protein
MSRFLKSLSEKFGSRRVARDETSNTAGCAVDAHDAPRCYSFRAGYRVLM